MNLFAIILVLIGQKDCKPIGLQLKVVLMFVVTLIHQTFHGQLIVGKN